MRVQASCLVSRCALASRFCRHCSSCTCNVRLSTGVSADSWRSTACCSRKPVIDAVGCAHSACGLASERALTQTVLQLAAHVNLYVNDAFNWAHKALAFQRCWLLSVC